MQNVTTTTTVPSTPPYDKTVALIGSIALAWVFGIHGFHRFYVGDVGLGIAMCLTCGGCCIWSIIDWVNIEQIVDDANRKKGWTGQQVVVQTVTVPAPGVPTYAPGYAPAPVQGYPPQGYPPPQQVPSYSP